MAGLLPETGLKQMLHGKIESQSLSEPCAAGLAKRCDNMDVWRHAMEMSRYAPAGLLTSRAPMCPHTRDMFVVTEDLHMLHFKIDAFSCAPMVRHPVWEFLGRVICH